MLTILIFSLLFISGFSVQDPELDSASCSSACATAFLLPTMINPSYFMRGVVSFSMESDPKHVQVTVEVSGLEPASKHSIHIHELGDITDSVTASRVGEPWNLTTNTFTGKVGTFKADVLGNIWASFRIKNRLSFQPSDPNFFIGRGVVMHEAESDDSARWLQGVIGYCQDSCQVKVSKGTKRFKQSSLRKLAAVAQIVGTKENKWVSGTARFMHIDKYNVSVQVYLRGLKPLSTHGIHIHEFGDISDPHGWSVGEHFNPQGVDHGCPTTDAEHGPEVHPRRHSKKKAHHRHAGDLGNWKADFFGVVKAKKMLSHLSLDRASKFFFLGRSIVVHLEQDDCAERVSGGTMHRIGFGVIGWEKHINSEVEAEDLIEIEQ